MKNLQLNLNKHILRGENMELNTRFTELADGRGTITISKEGSDNLKKHLGITTNCYLKMKLNRAKVAEVERY